jgi:hypothetical protein
MADSREVLPFRDSLRVYVQGVAETDQILTQEGQVGEQRDE